MHLSPLVNLTQKKFISYILVIFSFAHSSLNICVQILLAVTRTTKHQTTTFTLSMLELLDTRLKDIQRNKTAQTSVLRRDSFTLVFKMVISVSVETLLINMDVQMTRNVISNVENLTRLSSTLTIPLIHVAVDGEIPCTRVSKRLACVARVFFQCVFSCSVRKVREKLRQREQISLPFPPRPVPHHFFV